MRVCVFSLSLSAVVWSKRDGDGRRNLDWCMASSKRAKKYEEEEEEEEEEMKRTNDEETTSTTTQKRERRRDDNNARVCRVGGPLLSLATPEKKKTKKTKTKKTTNAREGL